MCWKVCFPGQSFAAANCLQAKEIIRLVVIYDNGRSERVNTTQLQPYKIDFQMFWENIQHHSMLQSLLILNFNHLNLSHRIQDFVSFCFRLVPFRYYLLWGQNPFLSLLIYIYIYIYKGFWFTRVYVQVLGEYTQVRDIKKEKSKPSWRRTREEIAKCKSLTTCCISWSVLVHMHVIPKTDSSTFKSWDFL